MSWRWWYHEVIDLEGGKEIAVVDSDGKDDKYGEGSAQEEIPGQN